MSKPSRTAVTGGVLAAIALAASSGGAASGATTQDAHLSSTAGAFVSTLHTRRDDRLHGAGERRRQPLRARRRADQRRLADGRRLPRQQLQREVQQPGHRHDDRRSSRPAGKLSVFATISAKTLPGACPGGVGLTTALEHPARRLRRRRQPADDQRPVGDGAVRLPDRARQRAVTRSRRSPARTSRARGT